MQWHIRSQTGEEVGNIAEHSKDGKPWTGSPVQQISNRCGILRTFTSTKRGHEKFNFPSSIAVSEKTGNIAIADRRNNRVLVFDSEWKHLRTIGDKGTGAEIIDDPASVAFTASGNVIVIRGGLRKRNITSVFTEHGHFITNISEHLINPLSVSVGTDGHLIVCDLQTSFP